MSRVRQRGTNAELAVAATLRDLGISYRTNVADLPGSPDFANRTRNWAVFVHGCFWHRHTNCTRDCPEDKRTILASKPQPTGPGGRPGDRRTPTLRFPRLCCVGVPDRRCSSPGRSAGE